MLKGKRGRRKKKDTFQGNHRSEGVWTFEKILSHKKVRKGDKDYRRAGTNCPVLWSTGEQTWEPLHERSGKSGLWIDDPVTVAIYARDNGLLDKPGWKLLEAQLVQLVFHKEQVCTCG